MADATMTLEKRDVAPRVRAFAWATLVLAAIAGVADVLAGLGYRAGWVPLAPGLQTIRWAAITGGVAGALALVPIVIAARRKAHGSVVVAAAGLLLALCVAGPPLYLWQRQQVLPHIHDVTTDTANPPQFVAVVPLRQGARNPTAYSPETAALQKEGYPDIGPILLEVPPPEAMRRAARVAREMRWRIVAEDPSALRIEATATTLLFGFKDDVVIRITPMGSGSRVDIRSLSRVGISDFGANANRIRQFSERLRKSS